MAADPGERGLPTEQVLMGRDHDDFFPWTWQRWVDGNGGHLDEGSISTPNGPRPDGTMHTYWQVAAPVHEFVGPYICAVVNAYEGKGWRARLARWLLRPAAQFGSSGGPDD